MERFDQSDEMIGRWLKDAADQRLPQRVLDATFERTRKSRQRIPWRAMPWRSLIPRTIPALGGAAVLVVAVVVAANLVVDHRAAVGPQPTAGPTADARSPFLGTWISTSDADGGTQTMTVSASADGGVEILVTDSIATVCSKTPSTMRGAGRIDASTKLVIAAPVYTCDDGSAPTVPSDEPPLDEQLRNLTYVHDPESDILTVGVGSVSVWRRPGAVEVVLPDGGGDRGQWDPTRFAGTWASSNADTGFLGTWAATDVDGSSLVLGIRAAEASPETLEILLLDDRAGGGHRRWPDSDWPSPLCSTGSGTPGPITMTGTGRAEGPALAVDPQTWLCGPGASSPGPTVVTGDRSIQMTGAYVPLILDREAHTLGGPAGVVWHRRSVGSDPIALPFWGIWPQSSAQDAAEAQRRADTGDPAVAWQIAPDLANPPGSVTYPFPSRVPLPDAADAAEILTRFFRDQLGWERSMTVSRGGPTDGYPGPGWDFVRIRCGPGTNPLYPNDSVGRDCPPTINGTQYETVRVRVMQPVHNGPTGIWVVSGWQALDPGEGRVLDFASSDWVRRQYAQLVPPTHAEIVDALKAFLTARVAGHGAEAYLNESYLYAQQPATVPLLYATSAGDRFERFEIVDVQKEADWPAGTYGVTVRLSARGGKDVVQQEIQMWPETQGRLSLDSSITLENGAGVPDDLGSME